MLNEYERIVSFLLQIAPTLVEHVCYNNRVRSLIDCFLH
jgi:hypothetical protein